MKVFGENSPATMSELHYKTITPEFFQRVLLSGDMEIIEETVNNPYLVNSLNAIIGYSRTNIQSAITAQVVKDFNSLGITCFGTTVRQAQVKILEYLDENPACRDIESKRCFNKILYKIAYEHQQQAQRVQQQLQQTPAIGCTFG